VTRAVRTTWNGSISFGLVNIAVGLAPATKPEARQSDVSFRMLHRECKTPIKQKRWCPLHEQEVPAEEIVKGWEVSKGEFLVVEGAELEEIARVGDSRSIEISRFVPVASVDPVYFDRSYLLVPAAQRAAGRAYVLLLRAMTGTSMAGIGQFLQAGKEKLALIRPKGDALALETLFLAEDVYSQAEIDQLVGETEVKEAELDLARQLVDSLVGEFEPTEMLVSGYRRDLRSLLEAKLAGEKIARPELVPDRPAVDLLEALKRSVADIQRRKAADRQTGRKPPATKRAPVRRRSGAG
jgi:DNA end-binding protein Ku